MMRTPAGDWGLPRALPVIPATWFVSAITLSLFTLWAAMRRAELTIEVASGSAACFALAAIMTAILAFRYRMPRSNGQRIARDLSEYVGVLGIMSLMGAVGCYPAAAISHGFVDGALARIDAALHFDWNALYAVVAAHPALQKLGMAAYASIFMTPAILLIHYAVANKRAEARLFLASFWLAAILTLVLYRIFPSVGPLAYQWHGAIPYMPTSALYQQQIIPLLREHMVHEISLSALRGLVGAPSFHTASAVLFMTAAWKVERLRWPLIALNIAMLMATPVEGTHYLSDMLCGALVAVAAMLTVRGAMRLFLSPSTGARRNARAFA